MVRNNYLEDANGNGTIDGSETDWKNADTDYDGRSDGQEIADGTDPLNPGSVLPLQLGFWRFNTTQYQGEQGQLPLNQYNMDSTLTAGVEGHAVNMAKAGSQKLAYRYVETNGHLNISLKYGTVVFWFKPAWTGTTNGGSGPAAFGRLINFGEWTSDASYGTWQILLHNSGDRISILAHDGNGNAVSSGDWLPIPGGLVSNMWRQIALAYTPTNTKFYVDGMLIGTGSGLGDVIPPTNILAGGFFVGADSGGNQKSRGTFDLLQTFNYSLSAMEISNNYSLQYPPSVSVPAIQSPYLATYLGSDMTYAVTATGPGVLGYQWQFNGANIAGATNASFTIYNALSNNMGNYSVVVSNYLGSVTSAPGVLSLTAPSYPVLFQALTNFTFQGDMTYLVCSNIQLYGTTIFEGGTVIKFPTQSNIGLVLNGPLVCKTRPYRPAVLTSKNDNSIGLNIWGNIGTPVTGNAGYISGGGGQTNAYGYLMVKYAGNGIRSMGAMAVWDSQFLNCSNAVANDGGGMVQLHNVLFSGDSNCVSTVNAIAGEHLTVDRCQTFCPLAYIGADVTNSIFTSVAVTNGLNLSYGVCLPDGTGVYQTVGGGSYYLATNVYQGAGTTNINPVLLAELRQKTTYPPIIFSSTNAYFTNSLNLFPQALRNTGMPDLGYHYEPLDYLMGGLYVTNASIAINSGTAIGIYDASRGYGLAIADNAQFSSLGTAGGWNHMITYNLVQERVPQYWTTPWYGLMAVWAGSSNSIYCRFTDLSVPAQDSPHLQLVVPTTVHFQDCQFHGGQFISYDTAGLTNCLLERVNMDFEDYDDGVPYLCNCTFIGGTIGFYAAATNTMVRDNLFDKTVVYSWIDESGGDYIGGYNAYVTGYDRMYPAHTGDLMLDGSPDYQAGVEGDYYLPAGSVLINAGSTTADQVGLYHFTTQMNQVMEANSVVDIGYHYVATDGEGMPLDINGTREADYIEDANGNGVQDGDETDWQRSATSGLRIYITRPRNGSTLP